MEIYDEETGLDKGFKEISYYNLRHTWALSVFRNEFKSCQNLGTGLQYLEEHYGQMKTKILRTELTKDLPPEIKSMLEKE